jgi:hypothetical protein
MYVSFIFTGRGVIPIVHVKEGDIVLEYTGKLREEEPQLEADDTYVFETTHKRKTYW